MPLGELVRPRSHRLRQIYNVGEPGDEDVEGNDGCRCTRGANYLSANTQVRLVTSHSTRIQLLSQLRLLDAMSSMILVLLRLLACVALRIDSIDSYVTKMPSPGV